MLARAGAGKGVPHRAWTPDEDAIIRAHYKERGMRACLALLPGRSKHAVMRRADLLGCLRRSIVHRPWTKEDDQILRDHYAKLGWQGCLEIMPKRSKQTIQARVKNLGISTRKFWTETEDKRLRALWELDMRLVDIAKEFGRSEQSTYDRAEAIGLQLGCPDGFETLYAAKLRAGFANTETLRKIMRWAGKKIVPSRSSPRKRSIKRRQHFVDPCDVDEAVAAWMATETIEGAARARGIAGPTLEVWLKQSGELEKLEHRAETHWRIPSEVIDRVVAERRAQRKAAA
jgi:hypothetical protein